MMQHLLSISAVILAYKANVAAHTYFLEELVNDKNLIWSGPLQFGTPMQGNQQSNFVYNTAEAFTTVTQSSCSTCDNQSTSPWSTAKSIAKVVSVKAVVFSRWRKQLWFSLLLMIMRYISVYSTVYLVFTFRRFPAQSTKYSR